MGTPGNTWRLEATVPELKLLFALTDTIGRLAGRPQNTRFLIPKLLEAHKSAAETVQVVYTGRLLVGSSSRFVSDLQTSLRALGRGACYGSCGGERAEVEVGGVDVVLRLVLLVWC